MIIEIDGIPIELLRKPIKSVNLRIYPPDGVVKVTAPMRFSEKLLRQHLATKTDWIRAQQERMKKIAPAKVDILQTGVTIPFKGINYFLIITEHNGPSQIKISGEVMHCYFPDNSSDAVKQKLLDQWYRREMESLLPELIKHWENTIGVQVGEWGIKKMKTRWGSCNTRARRIWLNLNLIKKPVICLEYVLVHELVHLLEASHNKRFYALMSRFMPEWREHEVLLEGKRRRSRSEVSV